MPEIIAILGPTASGKSAVALELARRVDGEIISCDSMQVYRGLDIGTAKPPAAEQDGVPHHLIDCCDISEAFGVCDFIERAGAAVDAIHARGGQPILCGGTGLYARALLYGYDIPSADASVRAAVQAFYDEAGEAPLLAELAAADAEAPDRVRGNPRRLIRAVETLRVTGEVARKADRLPVLPVSEWTLLPTLEINRERIHQRTREMLDSGWIEEAEQLIERGLFDTPTACQALGYRQIAAYLCGDIGSFAELAELIATATCQYAKRQRTWFRNQHPGATPIVSDRPIDPAVIGAEIIQAQSHGK